MATRDSGFSPALFELVISPQSATAPDAPAVKAQGRTCSYGLMEADIRRGISRLAAERLVRGAWVMIDTPDPYTFWTLAFACEALGLSVCAAPPGAAREQLCASLRPSLLLSWSTAPALPGVRRLRIDAAFVDDLARRPLAEAPNLGRDPEDPVLLLSTSGTTGHLKAVVLTRRMLEVRIAHFASVHPRFSTPQARELAMVGPWSLAGVLPAFNSWRLGGCLCSAEGATDWAATVIGLNPDHAYFAPVHLQQLVASLDGRRPGQDMAVFVIGGTPSPKLVARALTALTPVVWVSYGSTEAGVVAGGPADELGDGLNTAGVVFPWVSAEVIGDDGRPLAPDAVGELRLRLDGMADSYFGEPSGSLLRDGWYHPGDLASLSGNGVLRIHGRMDDLLHMGGGKVLPSELEAIVAPFPGVKECAAFTAPDSDDLEVPYLAVSAADGFDPVGAAQALAVHLGRPVRVILVDVLPRNALGKVERTKLCAAVVARAAAVS